MLLILIPFDCETVDSFKPEPKILNFKILPSCIKKAIREEFPRKHVKGWHIEKYCGSYGYKIYFKKVVKNQSMYVHVRENGTILKGYEFRIYKKYF